MRQFQDVSRGWSEVAMPPKNIAALLSLKIYVKRKMQQKS